MKKVLFLTLVCLSLIGGTISTVTAGDTGQHYINGTEGLKCGSLPGPGVYYRMYNLLYKADTMKDKNGDKNPVLDKFDLTAFANAHRFLWVKENEKIGGDLAFSAIIPLVYKEIETIPPPVDGKFSTFSMGDPYVDFVLSWHKTQFDYAVGAGLYFPFGDYDKDDQSTPGEDMWTLMLNFAGTYFFDAQKTWSASILARYETHTEKSDIKVKPGDDFHFEWGVAKTLARIWDVGIAGYCNWQVTDDSGSGADSNTKSDHGKVSAMGPEATVFLPPYKLQISLRTLFEYGAENGPEGNVTTLTFTKIF